MIMHMTMDSSINLVANEVKQGCVMAETLVCMILFAMLIDAV